MNPYERLRHDHRSENEDKSSGLPSVASTDPQK